ncbi:hypothetical protein [Neptunomonas sp.]|uniref:hypothetical protein n=1 Tax=Neptunomonas sp. TaxID=1971898 RepID=UPI00356A9E71
MADIPASVVTGSGVQLALRAAAQTDTTTYRAGKALVVANGSAGSVEVRAPSWYDVDTASDDVIATVPAGETWLVPLYARYAGTDGTIDLSYESITSVTVGVVDFPRVGTKVQNVW